MTEIEVWTVSEPFLEIRCQLGEGPAYNEECHELRFLDMNKKEIHFVDMSTSPVSLRTIKTECHIGVTVDIEGVREKLLAAAKYGFATVDRKTGKMEWLQRVYQAEGPEMEARMRMNDGAVDSRGRLWASSMNDTHIVDHWPRYEGSLFRLHVDGQAHSALHRELAIPNGIAWNIADDTMYITESESKDIYAFDFEPDTAQISNRRVFFHNKGEGLPDGLAIDVEDCLWSALFFGGKVIRISPVGHVVGVVNLPCPLATSITFIGTDLIITTARHAEKVPSQVGGAVFRVGVAVRGCRARTARLLPS